MTDQFKKISTPILDFADKFSRDNTFSMAASLAFYAALSIAPLLILFISVAAQISGSLQHTFVEEVTGLIGDRAGSAIEMIINAAKDRSDLKGFSGFFGFATLVISASAVFGELKNSLNRIFSEPDQPDVPTSDHGVIFVFLRDRILNIGFVLSFLFILLVSLILSSVISFYTPFENTFGAQVLNWLFSFAIQLVLFSLLYRFVPDQKRNWRQSALSGAITAILFSIGKEAVGFYIGRSAVASAYGAAGSIIVLLVWIYYSATIVFSGAQISYLITKKRGSRA